MSLTPKELAHQISKAAVEILESETRTNLTAKQSLKVHKACMKMKKAVKALLK